MKRKVYPLEGFAERLRDLWLASGKTQKEIAEQTGISRNAFLSYIYADRNPNALYLARLCGIFHVSADYLLFGKKNKDKGVENEKAQEKGIK